MNKIFRRGKNPAELLLNLDYKELKKRGRVKRKQSQYTDKPEDKCERQHSDTVVRFFGCCYREPRVIDIDRVLTSRVLFPFC